MPCAASHSSCDDEDESDTGTSVGSRADMGFRADMVPRVTGRRPGDVTRTLLPPVAELARGVVFVFAPGAIGVSGGRGLANTLEALVRPVPPRGGVAIMPHEASGRFHVRIRGSHFTAKTECEDRRMSLFVAPRRL